MPKDKEADPRIKELITWYCDVLYPGAYGVPYMFQGGREAKQLQSALRYFDKQFKDDAISQFKEACKKYMGDGETYLMENKHPWSLFLSKPHRWVGKKIASRRKDEPRKVDPRVEAARLDQVWQSSDDEEWLSRVFEEAGPDPRKFFRGYCATEGFLRLRHPKRWKKLSRAFSELLGPEECKRIYRQEKAKAAGSRTGKARHR